MNAELDHFDPNNQPSPNPESTSDRAAYELYGWAALVSAPVSAYHGYKRNDSLGWGIAWFVLGSLFPVLTPTIAIAQGFGKRRRK